MVLTQTPEIQQINFQCETKIIEKLDKIATKSKTRSLDEPKLNRSKLIRIAIKRFIQEDKKKNGK